jgi:MFS family permease
VVTEFRSGGNVINIIENRSYRHVLYITVYLTEGMVTLLVFTILPIYLKNYRGLSDLSIAILAGVSILPVILKPLVAVLTDSYPVKALGGQRKPYMVIGFILNGMTVILLGIIDPVAMLFLFAAMWVLQSLGLSLMDVALDALVVESFPETNEKLNMNITAQISTICAIFIAIPLAGVCESNIFHAGLHLTSQLGFDIFVGGNFDLGFLIAGVACTSLIVPTLFLKEGATMETGRKFSKEGLMEFLKSEHVPIILVVFFLMQVDNGLTDFTADPFLRILGISAGLQLISFSPAIILSLVGGIAAKWFVKKGIMNCLSVFTTIYGAYYVLLSALTFTAPTLIPIAYFGGAAVLSILSMAGYVMYLTFAMDRADQKMAATTLVVFFMMVGLGRLLGILIGGLIPYATYLKMGIIFAMGAVMMFVKVPLLLKLKRIEKTK